MTKPSFAIIALGANLPSASANVGETLRGALHILHENQDTAITGISNFWKTPAFPSGSGPDYLNAALTLRTKLTPENLLDYMHEIEASFGRRRDNGRWSARVLDMDLIAYEGLITPNRLTQRKWMSLSLIKQKTETPDCLILPHPRMQDRGFVLFPLAEIAPGWVHPVTGQTVREMRDALPASMVAEMVPCSLESAIIP